GRALVTLDGVPQNDPFGGWVIWSSLSPEIVSGAEVVKGAGAGPYGAGALTGVVALFEREDEGGVVDVYGGGPGPGGGARAGQEPAMYASTMPRLAAVSPTKQPPAGFP